MALSGSTGITKAPRRVQDYDDVVVVDDLDNLTSDLAWIG